MDLSCESIRHPEGNRPSSTKFVELHVLCVPDEKWDVKLNKVPAEAIESFVSAGFIRAHPDVTLQTLRRDLGVLLGSGRGNGKFSFLKCVGRSLALVKDRQERDLKVKTFAPPYASQPELYLLPAAEKNGSICFRSFTPETGSTSPEPQTHLLPKTGSLPTGTKGPLKFPLIPQCSHQSPSTPGPEEEEEEEDEEEEEEDSCSSTGRDGENEEERLSALKQEWAVKESCPRRSKNQRIIQCGSQVKGEDLIEEIKLVREERKQLELTRQELLRKGKDLLAQNRHRRNQARDSWKKKYFETKKATAPLEDMLRNLRQELEMFYDKLLHQLQARDKPRHQGRSSTKVRLKNELIIQIMTESHEIDNLRRKVEDAKMKLVTEIKLRKQAAMELRALKAELAQKKSQSSLCGLLVSPGFEAKTQDRPNAPSTSS
ncbi:spermatogenesis-associated protein 1 [Lampris incognitus]|uniref:spermatogenesis-associated protein 1 n=1 Tax=Lampris incognitus TaxID=2546036 RepID=UPI0024B58936|nr:spermatogenesis-associated protein 1 [Lampris incognitus]